MMNDLIPEQQSGKKADLSHTETFTSSQEALVCFQTARVRLLDPNIWHALCGALSAEFVLVQKEPHLPARINDHIKIDIPGPGPIAGKGYDWVEIKMIEDIPGSCIGMKLCPCSDPTNNNDDTAHFFTDKASSTFIVKRDGTTVTAYYHGRNETPNVKTNKTLDNVRNAVVASGAMASLSEAQWLKLIRSFIKNEEQK